MTRDELINCCHVDVTECSADNLVDLKQVDIAAELPVSMRMEHYMDQVQNPYLFRVDKLIVKVTFSGKRNLSSVLACLMAQS